MIKILFIIMVITMTMTEQSKSAKIENTKILMETSSGRVKIELFDNESPATVKNFIQYVDAKLYEGTIFHRVIPNFMIQGGGFTPDMNEKKTFPPVKNEADNGLKNLRGTLAMARTQVVDSATAQFFINVKDNTFLDHGSRDFGYCVFGKVIEGWILLIK